MRFNSLSKCVEDISVEWENNIAKLNELECAQFILCEKYDNQGQTIIENTDFKAIYGKNNETVRKNHVKNELSEMYDKIHENEREINHLKRRISFLKAMIYMKINEVDH